MKKLHFDYSMIIQYDIDVERCFYTIKCIPVDTKRQRILNLQIEMFPETKPEYAYDCHGNRYIYGCNQIPHSVFKFRISGEAECGLARYDAAAGENELMIFRHGSSLTHPGEKLKAYYKELIAKIPDFQELDPYHKALQMMAGLHKDFVYEKGATTVRTTAEEALTLGKGVCQDYSHILIALLNLAGCSARYVTGLIIGEGESHAWVEVADAGFWYGIDPTNNTVAGDSHIRIGIGRDASECQLNRGIMHGYCNQTQAIRAQVTEMSPGQSYIGKGTGF